MELNTKPPVIHNEDLLAKIIGASFLVMWLKGGLILVLLMFIYFFINVLFERKKYKKLMKKLKEEGSIFYKL